MPERLLHYASKPFAGPVVSKSQVSTMKPCGLWVSVEGENDWPSWCLGENFALGALTHVHEVALVEGANILHLSSGPELQDFTLRYCEEGGRVFADMDRRDIRWSKVADDYQGIVIAPYQWTCRMRLFWYYGWDCASGCIWDASAIAGVELLRVDSVPEPAHA